MTGVMWAVEKMGELMRSNPGIAGLENGLLRHIAGSIDTRVPDIPAFKDDPYGTISELIQANAEVNGPKAWNAARE